MDRMGTRTTTLDTQLSLPERGPHYVGICNRSPDLPYCCLRKGTDRTGILTKALAVSTGAMVGEELSFSLPRIPHKGEWLCTSLE